MTGFFLEIAESVSRCRACCCFARTPAVLRERAVFKEQALDAAASLAALKVEWVAVAAESVTSADVTAADSLVELDEALRDRGVKPSFAEFKDPVKDKLKRFGIYDRFGDEFFFATLGAAVDAYRATHDTN
jgi:MFS superfamily sulfate permease-like transporter